MYFFTDNSKSTETGIIMEGVFYSSKIVERVKNLLRESETLQNEKGYRAAIKKIF